jgi:hypothetical protein
MRMMNWRFLTKISVMIGTLAMVGVSLVLVTISLKNVIIYYYSINGQGIQAKTEKLSENDLWQDTERKVLYLFFLGNTHESFTSTRFSFYSVMKC